MLSGVTSTLAYLFQLVFFVGALFYLEWRLALVSLFVAPLFWLAARHFSRKIKHAAREERRRSGSISAVAEESLANAKIAAAARSADAHEFIETLPEGYDTVIGQKGRLLSGGQRQRLAIAWAMIRDAPILILDEPTTGLDARASEKIMAPLRRLMNGRTTIVVSHNLLTVRDATQIVVLEGGHIAEEGTHEELLERSGSYARLYRLHQTEEKGATHQL